MRPPARALGVFGVAWFFLTLTSPLTSRGQYWSLVDTVVIIGVNVDVNRGAIFPDQIVVIDIF